MKVSFDFDDTLDRKEIQEYAKELIDRGIEVWIVTSRHRSIEMYGKPVNKAAREFILKQYNNLFEIAEKLGIPEEHIHFTNMEYKYKYFEKNNDFIFHLDDSDDELRHINMFLYKKVLGVDSYRSDWKQICNERIQNVINTKN